MASPFHFSYDGRFDSAIGLPLPPSSPSSSRSTHAYSSAIAASTTATSHHQWSDPPPASRSTHSGSHTILLSNSETEDRPWSEINRRLDHAPSSSHWQFGGPTPAPTFDDFDPHGYPPQALEDKVATIASRLDLHIPQETTTNLCPSPTGLIPKRASGDDNTIHCGQCGIGFSGTWRRGNLNRHVKLKHTARRDRYACQVPGCHKGFARSDARIKHMRNHHHLEMLPSSLNKKHGHEKEPSTPDTASTSYPDLLSNSWTTQDFSTGFTVSPSRNNEAAQAHPLPPSGVLYLHDNPNEQASVKRTSTTDTQSSSASNLELAVGQWLTPSSVCEEPGVPGAQLQLQSEATVEALHLDARIVFGSLYMKLDADDYSRFCDTFFDRWARLLNHLRRKQSDTYVLYAQVVQDIRAVVDAIDDGAVDLTNFGSIHHSGRPNPGQAGGSYGSGGSNLGLGGTGAGSPPGRGSKPDGRKASKSNGAGNDARVSKKSVKKPNQRGVSCVDYKHWWMRRHDPSIPRPVCNDCCVTVMSQLRNHINRNNHGDFFVTHCSTCETDFVTKEAYDDHKAADSCDHVPQFRNNIIISWARLYIMRYPHETQIPHPYSDERGWLNNTIVAECRLWLNNITPSPFLGPRQGHSAPPGPAPAAIPVNTPIYNGAMNFVLQDIIAPSPTRNSNPNAAALSQSASRLTGLSPPTHAQREQFRRRLQGISAQYYQALRLAPNYMTLEELTSLADEAEATAHHIHTLQESQVQQNQAQTPAQLHRTPRRQPSSRAGRSTQPSTRSRHTGSSRQTGSNDTRPSSLYDPADAVHQGPLLSGTAQRPMTSPQAMYDGMRHQQTLSPYPQALPNQQVLPYWYQQALQRQQASPYQQTSPYQQPLQHQQASPPYHQAWSPNTQAGSPYLQEGLAQQQPWNFPQSPPNWQQDMQVYSPDGTINPSVFSSPGPDNGDGLSDEVRRQLWPPR